MKIGERVRVVNTDYNATELSNGQLGTIAVIGNGYVGVLMDSKYPHVFDPNNFIWNFYSNQLEVIQ